MVEARERSGFFVSLGHSEFEPPKQAAMPAAPQPVSVSQVFQDIMTRSAAFDLLPDLHSDEPPPGIIQLNRSIGRALRRQSASFQYYDEPAGDQALRAQLALRAAKRGWEGGGRSVLHYCWLSAVPVPGPDGGFARSVTWLQLKPRGFMGFSSCLNNWSSG